MPICKSQEGKYQTGKSQCLPCAQPLLEGLALLTFIKKSGGQWAWHDLIPSMGI